MERALLVCNIADMTHSTYTYTGLSITPTDIMNYVQMYSQ